MGQRMITQPTHAQVSEYTSLYSYFTGSKAFDCSSVRIFASIDVYKLARSLKMPCPHMSIRGRLALGVSADPGAVVPEGDGLEVEALAPD